jgi:lycopene cyclase
MVADHPIVLLEGGDQPFGEHTWSFHLRDLAAEDRAWVQPMIAHQWPGQSVRFRAYRRDLASGYASLTSRSVHEAVARLPNVEIRPRSQVVSLGPNHVHLADGQALWADCVIDARGYRPSPALALGYQKFAGLEVETALPHGVDLPVIMDASVDQRDGYRFVYLLPFSRTRLLIEDTRYADGETLDEAELERDILQYAAQQGWTIDEVIRRERGVLPISLAHDAERFWAEVPQDVPQAGMRAALFHPTTGYSLPEAVRLANLVAQAWPVGSAELADKIREHALRRHREQRFYRLLNRMLFLAAAPNRRHLVLQRFYRLPEPLIERFYAGRTTPADMARILVGKPPVPIHRALACLRESPLLTPEKT